MDRRTFLGVIAAGTVLLRERAIAAQTAAGAHPRIGVSSNSFRGMFRTQELNLFNYAQFARNRLDLTNLELIASLGFENNSEAFCRRVRASFEGEGCRVLNVLHTDRSVDFVGGDASSRAKSVEVCKRWMDATAALGAPSFRSNPNFTAEVGPDVVARILDGYGQLTEYGRSIGVKLMVENHVGYTNSVDRAIEIIRGVNSPNIRGILDWGNSPASSEQGRIADFLNMLPYVELVSAKGINFDAQYNHLNYPIAPLVQAYEKGGYKGIYSVDLYSRQEPADPVRAVRSMVSIIQANLV